MSANTKAKLYYSNGSCGAASFIAASYSGLLSKLDTEQVNIQGDHKTASGEDFYKINYKGNVPALVLPNGVLLNEGAAILQWIADQPESEGKLAPANGTIARYQLQNVLNFLSSELHGTAYGTFFKNRGKSVPDEIKQSWHDVLNAKLNLVSKHLLNNGEKQYLIEGRFSVADSYLYIILSWTPYLNLSLDPYPVLKAYFEHIKSLPFVKTAHDQMNAASAAAKKD